MNKSNRFEKFLLGKQEKVAIKANTWLLFQFIKMTTDVTLLKFYNQLDYNLKVGSIYFRKIQVTLITLTYLTLD